MMLMMIVFSLMSAGLLYASRVPAVQEEINALTGGKLGSSAVDYGRFAQITFIMFTLTSPLILAGVLSTLLGVVRWWGRRRV